jgi:hypothetical protein
MFRRGWQELRRGEFWRGDLWQSWGLIVLSGLLVLNCGFSAYPAESLLQLVNYLPFFAAYQVLTRLLGRDDLSRQLAVDGVLAALPINLIAVIEFGIKIWRRAAPHLTNTLQVAGWPSSEEPNRAESIFSHPNFLASYMVIILGLGLGLVVGMNRQSFTPKPWLQVGIIAAIVLSFAGIFCSGSRNALAVAILQVLLAASLLRLNRWLRLAGLLSLVGLGVIVASFGLGGRPISLEVFGRDPRFGLWQIAVGLIQERPWLGWGLGSFKFLYPSRLIDPGYPYIAHPHNFGLMMATEVGLPTMLLFFAVIGAMCYSGVKAYQAITWRSPEKSVLLACLLACLGSFAYALFDTTLFDVRINLLNWTVLAVLTGLGLPQPPQQRE